MSARVPISKPASISAARASRTSLPKRRASSRMSAKSRAAARSNSASSLRPASSSGASVGPPAVEEEGKSGGVCTARSVTTSAVSLRMTSRQNVSLSWMRSVAQPRARAEVFCGPCRQVLREQGRSPGQQKALARGQAEEQPGHLELEVRQVRHAGPSHGSLPGIYATIPRDVSITGTHADRTARGSTRSSQRSTSSAPST